MTSAVAIWALKLREVVILKAFYTYFHHQLLTVSNGLKAWKWKISVLLFFSSMSSCWFEDRKIYFSPPIRFQQTFESESNGCIITTLLREKPLWFVHTKTWHPWFWMPFFGSFLDKLLFNGDKFSKREKLRLSTCCAFIISVINKKYHKVWLKLPKYTEDFLWFTSL